MVEQPDHTRHLPPLRKEEAFEAFGSLPQQISCLGQTHPDLLYIKRICSQVTADTISKLHINLVNSSITYAYATPDIRLRVYSLSLVSL